MGSVQTGSEQNSPLSQKLQLSAFCTKEKGRKSKKIRKTNIVEKNEITKKQKEKDFSEVGGGVRAEVSGRGPRLLRSCLGVEISIRNPSKRSPSRSGSMRKLVLKLSYFQPHLHQPQQELYKAFPAQRCAQEQWFSMCFVSVSTSVPGPMARQKTMSNTVPRQSI